jgi:hypothetical protein
VGHKSRRLTKCSVGVLAGELAGFSFDSGGGTPPVLAGEDACATLSSGQIRMVIRTSPLLPTREVCYCLCCG